MKELNSQMSHHTGVQFTTFPSHTIELTNQMREERPVQKIKRHVPAFQLEASVRCQVRGTEAEVKANREKMVNTWLAAGIFQCLQKEQAPGELEAIHALVVVRIASCTVPVFRYGGGDRDTRSRSGTDTSTIPPVWTRRGGRGELPPTL